MRTREENAARKGLNILNKRKRAKALREKAAGIEKPHVVDIILAEIRPGKDVRAPSGPQTC